MHSNPLHISAQETRENREMPAKRFLSLQQMISTETVQGS